MRKRCPGRCPPAATATPRSATPTDPRHNHRTPRAGARSPRREPRGVQDDGPHAPAARQACGPNAAASSAPSCSSPSPPAASPTHPKTAAATNSARSAPAARAAPRSAHPAQRPPLQAQRSAQPPPPTARPAQRPAPEAPHSQATATLHLRLLSVQPTPVVRGGCVGRVGRFWIEQRTPSSRPVVRDALDCVSVQLGLARRLRPGNQSRRRAILVPRSPSTNPWRGASLGDRPAAREESADARGPARTDFRAVVHTTLAIGVESNTCWPCGQDSQLKPGCHRRRALRHEARGVGYWF